MSASPAATIDAAPEVELESLALADIDPPPAVEYTFEGHAAGLGKSDFVFVVGKFDDSTAKDSSSSPNDGFAISPPAKFLPDGSWQVTGNMPSAPHVSQFSAIVTEGLSMSLLPGEGDGGGGGFVVLSEGEIRRLGPQASSVSATDSAAVAELLSHAVQSPAP